MDVVREIRKRAYKKVFAKPFVFNESRQKELDAFVGEADELEYLRNFLIMESTMDRVGLRKVREILAEEIPKPTEEEIKKQKEIEMKNEEIFKKMEREVKAHTNTLKNPMKVTEHPWLYRKGGKSRLQNLYRKKTKGKWMVFKKNEEMDKYWKRARKLYTNRLCPIVSMKCSTAYDNDRASSKDYGVIIFYSLNDIQTGKYIYDNMDCKRPIYYKSDFATMIGTVATGHSGLTTNCYPPKADFKKTCFI